MACRFPGCLLLSRTSFWCICWTGVDVKVVFHVFDDQRGAVEGFAARGDQFDRHRVSLPKDYSPRRRGVRQKGSRPDFLCDFCVSAVNNLCFLENCHVDVAAGAGVVDCGACPGIRYWTPPPARSRRTRRTGHAGPRPDAASRRAVGKKFWTWHPRRQD